MISAQVAKPPITATLDTGVCEQDVIDCRWRFTLDMWGYEKSVSGLGGGILTITLDAGVWELDLLRPLVGEDPHGGGM